MPLLAVMLLFSVLDTTHADRGRQYYEEAGHIIWEINTEAKVIALTFDDGPHRKYTPQILDLLKKHNAKATFFIVGAHAEKNPDIVLRMAEEGHELANHTYTHSRNRSVPYVMEEIKKTNEVLFSISGQSTTLFRPVEGIYTDELVEAVVKEGYKIVMWSWHLDTLDWKNPGVGRIVRFVLEGVSEGNVVLFHDGGGNRHQTVEALEKILPDLEEKGYTFVTISELMKIREENQNEQQVDKN
ncbi:polysaccharide deacetylase family protein [Sporosarcina sp. ACRSL]|nr:polysaccharide deacetylase family protein [Sporosarcina sp. ACRSL]